MNKNVIIASNAYWPSIGGIENSLRHLSLESILMKDYAEVIVSDIGAVEFRKCENIDGINVHRYKLRSGRNNIFNFIKSNVDAFNLFRNKFKEKPDAIVIARFHLSVIYAYIAGYRNIRYLVPSIVKMQCQQEIKNISFKKKIKTKLWMILHSYLQKKALEISNVFVFSDTMKDQCDELTYCGDIKITKPGVDTNRFYPDLKLRNKIRENYNIDKDEKVILFIGRFVKAKQIELLISSFHLLNKGKLILVGDGEEKSNIISLVNKLNLSKRVLIIEPCRNVEDIYKIADVFVMSSSYEPLGQTIIEAFASGLPVVAFKKSIHVNTATQELGMDEFIYYSQDFNKESLYEALYKSLNNNCNKHDIHISAKNKFNWNNLYLELISD